MSDTRLLLIVGREKDERGLPFIVGAFNEEYLNQLPVEDAEEKIAELKQTWTGDPDDYDWREARIRIQDGHLMPMFSTPELRGELEASNQDTKPEG